jgi:hypothetical protein
MNSDDLSDRAPAAPVAPPLGGQHVEALREGRNCSPEFRGISETAVQQHERITGAVFGAPGVHATGIYVSHSSLVSSPIFRRL